MKHLITLFASAAILVAACNGDTASTAPGTFPADSPPAIASTSPLDAATMVPQDKNVTATFATLMDAATLNGSTFELRNGDTLVPGVVTYDGTKVKLTPSAPLALNTVFTATVSTGAKDVHGTALPTATSWSFTTIGARPTVVSTSPAHLAIGVPRNASITATFSEAMDPATLNGTTFILKGAGLVVPAVVTYTGTTAKLDPVTALRANAVYYATISTGARSQAGRALVATKSWKFTTVASSRHGPAKVNLGTAANYVILAKSGVSTTGTTAVVGDIGLSPAAATFVTGFALIANAANTSAASSLVTGRVWASSYAAPTPTKLTTAVLDMQTAYTDAAGRVLPDFTELGAGNIQGLVLVPGLYKWGTGVTIPSAVTLSGGATDIWIFQIAQDLNVGNGAIVTLTGGAQAKNVFWQVAGQATLGTTADFKGIILSQTLISFNTGASILGRALAQTAVTLNGTAVTHP